MTANLARQTFALFGNFGAGNLGNEVTLQAFLYHLRRYVPNAQITCICPHPEDAASRHKISAYPMRDMFIVHARKNNIAVRWLRRLFIRLPMEPYRWIKAITMLKGSHTLVITGTGMTTGTRVVADFGYDILVWSLIAKLCRCKLLFVSVGVNPLRRPVTRYFLKASLALADYRSYRDIFSQEHLQALGFDTRHDTVYPDLAFSLPRPAMPARPDRDGTQRVIGVGLITHYYQRTPSENVETIYCEYVAKIAIFVTWLLEHKYTVRLVIGDFVYDGRVRQDLRELLERGGLNYENGRIIDEPATSVDELLSQLATTDVVVASRFHNVVLALMLKKPVVAISFHEKVESLMTAMGLKEFCQDIAHVDVERLIGQFTTAEESADSLKRQIERKTEDFRKALDEQYDLIFKSV
jgi:polysaccharide pyruvyl transferase WcaK-like protein